MIHWINSAMVELQSAVLARALYPLGHPRIRTSEEKALQMLTEVLAQRMEVTVFAVGERIVFDDEVLPSSPSLGITLFRILRDVGIDQITVRAGLDAGELERFLDALAAPEGTAPKTLRDSPHLSFGAIVREEIPAHVSASPSVDVGMAADLEAAGALSGVWESIHASANLEAVVLRDIVSTLSRVVIDSSHALLPLASVKSYDEYTFVHIINVGILSMSLGEALGFSKNLTHELGIAALLHDVGKMAVPLEVLNKNGRFTEEEFLAMQVHPVEGARMLLRTRGVSELSVIVAYEHHVRYDGGGYPKVPAGWKLGLASRICQLADVYDALRTDRPYRPGMPVEKIVKIMKADAGTYFDPELLTVFLEQVVPRVILPEPSDVELDSGASSEANPSAAAGTPAQDSTS